MQKWYNKSVGKESVMSMITVNKNVQSEFFMSSMEELVPEDNLFRKIERNIDFAFIYDEVKDLYCCTSGDQV